jgi:acetyl/propionyl-CoA carboxylase alpha subunit
MHVPVPGQLCARQQLPLVHWLVWIGGPLPSLAQVPPNYDSLLGKLIVWAEDRPQAIARMKRALNECVIAGVPTTCTYHTMILDIEDFKNGIVDTGFIPKHQDELATPPAASKVAVPQHLLAVLQHVQGGPYVGWR